MLTNNNNNNNANICIARLKQNSSDALMAQTNTVSVFVQMTTVTASVTCYMGFVGNLIFFVTVQKLWKSVHIWQGYHRHRLC